MYSTIFELSAIESYTETTTLDHTNTVVITTTMPRSERSSKRRSNLVDLFSASRLKIVLLHGVQKQPHQSTHDVMYHIVMNALTAFRDEVTAPYGILCDDDFSPHPDLMNELNRTVASLPSGWRTLHLCPGFFWDRLGRGHGQSQIDVGALHPEREVPLRLHASGRFFVDGYQTFATHRVWLGGPIAMLVNRSSIQDFIDALIKRHAAYPDEPNDVAMTHAMSPDDYVCATPQLGYENEQGGSLF